ncbi:SH3 domain-containing protein [Methylobacterium sp. A49B]|uniref:SH3 domain-containing protein n=1 Tax=Methylobacterium mesophilicum SR1.6/6 TaxID=908290 RepID=A0A6B9FF88_9HYPH|nr:SH3 domain-containing protein [Methylobacterium mesophilicum]QGY01631.1 SH3 domain-containing protein [Methylobacterium mesophilicum SR1.6/6]
MRVPRLSFAVAALLAGGLATGAAAAPTPPETGVGPVTKLPLPRYASLKTDRVNLREGPSKDHRTLWVFQRAGLPVEIVGEFETWRRIRDSEGTEGWVLHSLLSGRRTALVNAGPDKGVEKAAVSLRAKADDGAEDEARLQTGVIGSVKSCTGTWCRLIVALPNKRDVDGYIRQNRLWGVYPNEVVE